MESEFIIVGAGIGGLAAALALGRERRTVCVLEQADAFTEAGAGIQLGPNAVRVLHGLGLADELAAAAARPERLQALDAHSGRVLGELPLDRDFRSRYGFDYLTLHRGDLHHMLLRALDPELVRMRCASAVRSVAEQHDAVFATTHDGAQHRAAGLVACDGLWSVVRQQLLGEGPVRTSGHVAYRAMLDSGEVPRSVARDQVTLWLGRHMHAVAYPVRSGTLMNLVVVAQGQGDAGADAGTPVTEDAQRWDLPSDGRACLRVLQRLDPALLDLAQAIAPQAWKRWILYERAPVRGPAQMSKGRIALLGDSAHPMRPYLAQGAAMALEDAQTLAGEVQASPLDITAAFERYAQKRWRRNARVQRKSRANGLVFHAGGMLRLARNLALRQLGRRLMDQPWLYRS